MLPGITLFVDEDRQLGHLRLVHLHLLDAPGHGHVEGARGVDAAMFQEQVRLAPVRGPGDNPEQIPCGTRDVFADVCMGEVAAIPTIQGQHPTARDCTCMG